MSALYKTDAQVLCEPIRTREHTCPLSFLFPHAPKDPEVFSKGKEGKFPSFQIVSNWGIHDDYPLLMTSELLEQLPVNRPSCDLVHVRNRQEDDAWKILFILRLPNVSFCVC